LGVSYTRGIGAFVAAEISARGYPQRSRQQFRWHLNARELGPVTSYGVRLRNGAILVVPLRGTVYPRANTIDHKRRSIALRLQTGAFVCTLSNQPAGFTRSAAAPPSASRSGSEGIVQRHYQTRASCIYRVSWLAPAYGAAFRRA
jgi:hypothetical protein